MASKVVWRRWQRSLIRVWRGCILDEREGGGREKDGRTGVRHYERGGKQGERAESGPLRGQGVRGVVGCRARNYGGREGM